MSFRMFCLCPLKQATRKNSLFFFQARSPLDRLGNKINKRVSTECNIWLKRSIDEIYTQSKPEGNIIYASHLCAQRLIQYCLSFFFSLYTCWMPRGLLQCSLKRVQIKDSGYIYRTHTLDPVENETNVQPFETSVGRFCWRNQLFTHAQSITVSVCTICGAMLVFHRFWLRCALILLQSFEKDRSDEIWMGCPTWFPNRVHGLKNNSSIV